MIIAFRIYSWLFLALARIVLQAVKAVANYVKK